MSRTRQMVVMVAVCLLFSAGCETENSGTNEPLQSSPTTENQAPDQDNDVVLDNSTGVKQADVVNVEIPLEIRTWEEIQAWIADQQGKVVVVDLWSTYCGPCRREFPHFVALHNQLGEDVACVSVSLDFYKRDGKPEDVRPEVEEFLKSEKSSMQNFISSTPDSEVLKKINSAYIPVVLVYDQNGKLYKRFSNDDEDYGPEGFTYAKDIVPAIKSLLE